MGLIDALQPSSGRSSSYVWGRRRPQHFHIIVTEDGSKVASGGFSRGKAPGVTVSDEALASTGFYGQFWKPPSCLQIALATGQAISRWRGTAVERSASNPHQLWRAPSRSSRAPCSRR